MSTLPDRSWSSIYESQPSSEGSYLVDEFYVPALKRSTRYDRIAGYFSSSALAVASKGIDALLENDGEMRLVVGTELYTTDRPVLEALTDELSDSLEELDDEQLDAQLQLLARLLREDRLHIKVAVPRQGSWRIFHPKMGIFHDDAGNALSFEGSVNETVGGWKNNYERFKIHRSWVDQQSAYVDSDVDTFERLWDDDHPYVKVHDLPEAIVKNLIDWKDPDSQTQLEEAIQIARGEAPPTERDKANIIADGHLSPGGLALAEEASTITPWPHQRVVSDTLVNTYPNSFLLCDEVGLGKTIEAGLTLSRLGLTNELETGLLLVPASLAVQWQEEMWEKFNLNTYRYERGSEYEYAFIDAFGREQYPLAASELDLDADEREQAWVESPIWRFLHESRDDAATNTPTVVIMSWHTARLEDRWNQVAPKDGGTVRTREDVPASCRGRQSSNREGVWDAVIVDEAHNGRKGSSFYTMLERLRDHTQTYYLLTATPMQLHAGELYDLMSLLDLPGEWDNQDDFEKFFETRRALGTALDKKLGGDDSAGDDSWSAQATLTENRYQDRLTGERSISDRVLDTLGTELEIKNEQQARAIAKQRVLRACDLARDYGEHYDGYIESFERALDEYDINRFEAKEDEKLKYLLYPEWKADEEWLTYSRNERLSALDELTEAGWRVVQEILSESTPVDALIHRNTRNTLRKYEQVDLLDATVPTRDPEQRKIELTEETREVYDRIDDYTRKFYKLAQQSDEADTRAIGFVMTTYRQRLTSSVYAISQSLRNRLAKLRSQRTVMQGKQQAGDKTSDSKQVAMEAMDEYDLDDVDELDELDKELEEIDLAEIIPNVTDEGLYLLEKEIEELESFADELEDITQDPKISQLKADLNEIDRQGHNRAIIFTQYTDTMDFIRESLISIHGETVATYSGRGGEMYDYESGSWVTVGKERVKREFSADDGTVEILICTDSASEGLNLQECGVLINYDLPWNPMRVEQRIGRIDRIGQEFEEVTILNYSYEDTVETDIYERLDTRIGLFENVVGEMQPILSGVSNQIRSATLETDRTESREAVERADKEFSDQIDQEEDRDRVDVGESLETVDDDLVKQDVIDEAKLDAWQSYRHPDIAVSRGIEDEDNYQYAVPFDTSGLEAVLTQSEALTNVGVVFTPFEDLDLDAVESVDIDSSEFKESIYRLQCTKFELPQIDAEQTVSEKISPGEDKTAVTFSAECADEYPSLQYLAPGNPLLNQLIQTWYESSEEPERFSKYTNNRDMETDPLICGWGRDGDIMRVDTDGTTPATLPMGELSEWLKVFLDNREANSTTS